MGTAYQVKVARESLAEARRAEIEATILAELDLTNELMSTYVDDSELMRLNRAAAEEPFALSEPTRAVFSLALETSRRTAGAFDVTIGPLVNAWGFGPGSQVRTEDAGGLSDEELQAIAERVGYEQLTLDEAAGTVTKSRADLFCDLSAIAKGYGVDRLAEALLALGERDFMVEVGGEVRAAGRNVEGKPWQIGIERPQLTRGTVHRVVPLQDLSLATSGDYRNYREVEGVRVAHIFDPRTKRPITHRLASVSVVDERCAVADALATALFVLGEAEGYDWAVGENVAAIFLVRDGEGFRDILTPAFETLLEGVQQTN
jgi:thiamine biosynthesis lipoprotein